MGPASGYEYSYDISMDDKIISSYTVALIPSSNETIPDLGTQRKVFIFETRTKFTVRRKLDEDDEDAYDCEMMESEAFSVALCVSTDQQQHGNFLQRFYQHFSHIKYRLKEYLMPDDQIQSLIQDALDYTEQIVAVHPSIPVVPIVVGVNVCTVQLDGETMDDTFNRSVSPDCLTPLHLVLPMEKKDKLCRRRLLDFLLFGLPRIRVDDVEGFDLMEACPICMGGPTVGAPVSILPCRHAFHSHCVIRWFMERESCPLCRHEIVLEKVKDLASCYKCDTPPQPNNGIGSFGPSSQPMNDGPSEVVVQEEEMATQRRHKRKRQPSSRLKDYYVTY